MKIRISGNTIRFRLKEPEVESFAKAGMIRDQIQFGLKPDECIQFKLERSSKANLDTSFINNIITVFIPENISNEWVSSDQVGIEANIMKDGINLSVLIEKDFACLDRNDADNEGTYPNPLANCLPANADHR